jgi:hypothetical protein
MRIPLRLLDLHGLFQSGGHDQSRNLKDGVDLMVVHVSRLGASAGLPASKNGPGDLRNGSTSFFVH